MEGFTDPSEFITELLSHIDSTALQKIKHLFTNAKNEIEELQILNIIRMKLKSAHSWKNDGTKIFHELKKNRSKIIVIIDELPIYLLRMEEKYQDNGTTISTFLHWLRSIRQDLQIRFIVCGSIGINSIIDKYGLENSVNDLSRLSLLPFDDETAKGMITTLLDKYNIEYTEDLIREIMDQIGLQVPFFIQSILREIRDRTNYGDKKLTSEIIADSYRKGPYWVLKGKKILKDIINVLKENLRGKIIR